MTMSKYQLGPELLNAFNSVKADKVSIDNLGDKMYEAMLEIQMNQGSNANGDLGRERFRKMAEQILNEILSINGELGRQRFIALADALIQHIRKNATIFPLSTSATPAGDPLHTHNTITLRTTGKIY